MHSVSLMTFSPIIVVVQGLLEQEVLSFGPYRPQMAYVSSEYPNSAQACCACVFHAPPRHRHHHAATRQPKRPNSLFPSPLDGDFLHSPDDSRLSQRARGENTGKAIIKIVAHLIAERSVPTG